MAGKSANLYVRIEPQIKEEAEEILDTLGISTSSAINMFFKQIILQRGLPFEVKMPEKEKSQQIKNASDYVFYAELEKGYGKNKTARQTFADIKKEL